MLGSKLVQIGPETTLPSLYHLPTTANPLPIEALLTYNPNTTCLSILPLTSPRQSSWYNLHPPITSFQVAPHIRPDTYVVSEGANTMDIGRIMMLNEVQ